MLFYVLAITPLLRLAFPDSDPLNTSRLEHRLFWPAASVLSLWLAMESGRASIRAIPLVGWSILAYLSICGVSLAWAVSFGVSLTRYLQQCMIICTVMLPCLFSARRTQIIDSLLASIATTAAFNLVALGLRAPTPLGFAGIYDHKNVLGESAALIVLYGFYAAVRFQSFRRLAGAFSVATGLVCLVASQSKTSLGLAVLCPALALSVMALGRALRLSPLLILAYLAAALGFIVFVGVAVVDASSDDVLTMVFGDPTFTGRTDIWTFVTEMIQERPLAGYGYQGFWLSGPEAPSLFGTDWIARMPHAHNGYLDALLDNGLLGFWLVPSILGLALRSVEKAFGANRKEALFGYSMLLFFMLHNMLESSFFRGFTDSWILFLIVATASAPGLKTSARASAPATETLRPVSLQRAADVAR